MNLYKGIFFQALSLLFLGLMIQFSNAQETVEGDTLRNIRERGFLNCGVGTNDPGFAQQDINGKWRGFDVDFCRAIATASPS